MVTTVPAVKAKLITLFTAAVEPETQVWFNRTNEEHRFDENIYVCGVHHERVFHNIGKPRPTEQESYSIDVEVEVYRDGTDAEGTETRLWAIIALLEGVFEDPSLGKQEGVQWALIDRLEQTSTGGAEGWLCAAVLSVHVEARI